MGLIGFIAEVGSTGTSGNFSLAEKSKCEKEMKWEVECV